MRIRERLRISEETFHLLLAGLVGVMGGLVNLTFYSLSPLGHDADSWRFRRIGRNGSAAWPLATSSSSWHRRHGGGTGALRGLRLVGPQGSSHIVEVVVAGDGRLRFRSAIVKAISSIISISTGASIGREGSITQLTATLASKGGQLAGWQPYRLRLLVACGAASGIAATYNAPVAGAVFAAQIVLGNFAMNLFAPLVFASVISTMVSRSFFGLEPLYKVPAFDFTSIYQLPWFLLLGILAGGLGALFLKMLRYAEDRFEGLRWPIYDRLALGGLAVGVLAIAFPEVWGNGFSVTNGILHGQFDVVRLLGVFLAKLLATMISVGSGAIGGVFTPTLFLGAGLGSLLGTSLHHLGVAENLPVAAFALVGMGSVLAATVHSPLLSLIMILEISLNYSLMPALMLGCVTATLVARRLHSESIYIEPLRRKGVDLERENQQIGAATSKIVGEVMREPVPPLRETASFRAIAERFLTSSNNFLPVVDADSRLLGVVALQDMKEYLNSGLEFQQRYRLRRDASAAKMPDPKSTPDRCVTGAAGE